MDAWVYLVSHASSVKLFAVRPAAQRSLEVYVDVKNRVSVRNNIGAVTTYGRTTMANGGWHRVVLDATVGSGTGKLAVAVDGVAVPGLTLTGQNLGTPLLRRAGGWVTRRLRRRSMIVIDDIVNAVA